MNNILFNRRKLYDLVWSDSLLSLSKIYNISDVGLRKACIRMEIPLPDSGYWNKVKAGILKERKIGYGTRGRVLEVEKNDYSYTKENCVLACYYCNNDKSYTTSKEDYKDYFGSNRHEYFKTLINKLNNTSL